MGLASVVGQHIWIRGPGIRQSMRRRECGTRARAEEGNATSTEERRERQELAQREAGPGRMSTTMRERERGTRVYSVAQSGVAQRQQDGDSVRTRPPETRPGTCYYGMGSYS